jgi:DNA replication protein DnaC
MPSGTRAGAPQVLLGHQLKQLKLPTVLREYDKVTRECAQGGIDHSGYLLRLVELELIDRERRVVERRIPAARFPAVKSFDTFDFTAIPSLKKMLVLELGRCAFILRRENVIALGNSGTGKTHATSGARPSSPRTSPSRTGRPSWDRSGSPAPCSTGSPTTSAS